MDCRFILGRAGTGKTHHCLNSIREILLASKESDNRAEKHIVFLLPEQSTFIHERKLALLPGVEGYTNVDVIGFRRLSTQARRFMDEKQLPHLKETGKLMLMTKLLAENRANMQVFAVPSGKTCFCMTMLEIIKEMKTYKITPAVLEKAAGNIKSNIHKNAADELLSAKLHDIGMLCTAYDEFIKGSYSDEVDDLRLLEDAILNHGFLKDSIVFIDGFASFDPLELAVLRAVFSVAARAEISLLLDPILTGKTLGEEHFFFQTWETYHSLCNVAAAVGARILPSLKLSGDNGRFAARQELTHLERNLLPISEHKAWQEIPADIHIHNAADKRTEIEGVGREIIYLVREKNYRYRDISIVTRQAGDYSELIEQVFTDYGIPFFADKRKPMLYHPLIEFLRAAMEAAEGNFHHRYIFRFLKSIFSPISADEAALLENYCLANGTKHYHWEKKGDWTFYSRTLEEKHDEEKEREILAQVNDIRYRGTAHLLNFCRTVRRTGATVADVMKALKTLLTDLNIEEKMTALYNGCKADGAPEAAEIHRQINDLVSEILGQAEFLLGVAVMPLDQLIKILDVGFSALTASVIPPSVDQVFVASVDRSRTPESKICFVLGANEGVFPAIINADSILSSNDRERLKKAGCHMAPTVIQRQFAEHYLMYVALTRGSEALYISYPLANENGQSLIPSIIIKRAHNLFPLLTEKCYDEEDLRTLTGGHATIAALSRKIKDRENGLPIAPYWNDVYSWYSREEKYSQLMDNIENSLSYRANPKTLSKESTQLLWGQTIRSSVSRLENFKQCPLSYFANYSLKLRKRAEYTVSAPDKGQLLHAVLSYLGELLAKEDAAGENPWDSMTQGRAKELARDGVEKFMPDFMGDILSSSARYKYLARRITDTVAAGIMLLSEQMKRGDFRQVAWEVAFGSNGELESLTIQLDEDCRLVLSGRIDRIDAAQAVDTETGEKKLWLRVIDYKSGVQNISVKDIYQGTKLQLMVYLQVALLNTGKLGLTGEPKPAGAFYFSLRDEFTAVNAPQGNEQESSLAGLKMQGLAVKDMDAVLAADRDISGHSAIIPVAVSSKGFRADSSGVTEDELALLQEHLRKILKESALELISGAVDAIPSYADNSYCSYCDFKSFCGFDYDLSKKTADNTNLKKEDIFKLLSEEGDSDGESRRGVSVDE